MERIIGFDCPTQVTFWNEELKEITGGIGVEDYVICGCCGTIVSLEEIYEAAEEDGVSAADAVKKCGCWEDLSDFIKDGKDAFVEANLPYDIL